MSEAATKIAVIGAGCRFPGGSEGVDAYWELLANGVDATGEIPAERWDVDALYDPEPGTAGKMYTRRGGFLAESIRDFDAAFFGMSALQASFLDPQQRLNLESAWQAMEHAGLRPRDLATGNTGVFVGASSSGFMHLQNRADRSQINAYSALGSTPSANAGIIGHHLRLTGPSMTFDTACASSLVAVHEACESIRRGECDMAFAGGATVLISPEIFISFSQARMLSPDGRCKTFDASADGYARAEGAGMLLLKRLDRALEDGDQVLAVIRGSATNHGTGRAITAPNGPAQQACIRAALARAGVEPHEVGLIEAHGTGTALGDPIEVHALRAVFGGPRPHPLFLGSVKTNIGHLEVAAGVAGLLKVILALQQRKIPAHLHFREWNPHIDLGDLDVRVPTETVPWTSEGPRIAGVSGFGFQGTNAHIVVEEAPPPARPADDTPGRPFVVALSARRPEDLAALAGEHASRLPEAPAALRDWAATSRVGRTPMAYRALVWGADAAQLREALHQVDGSGPRAQRQPLTLLFTGQAGQYAGMGRELYASLPPFRAAIDACAAELDATGGLDHDLRDVLWGDASAQIDDTRYTQPALFCVQYALLSCLDAWGLRAAAVLGHSVGEFAAAVAAGVLDWRDALALVVERGRLMSELDGDRGAMAVVSLDEAHTRASLRDGGGAVEVAAINAPGNTVVAGPTDAVEAAVAGWADAGIRARRLPVSHAFHSAIMDPMIEAFRARVAQVRFRPPTARFVSTLTGTEVADELCTADYWCRQIREPVRFLEAIRTCVDAGDRVLAEVALRPGLSAMAAGCVSGDESEAITLVPTRRDGEWSAMLDTLGGLWSAGIDVDWAAFAPPRPRVALPTYPLQREPHWIPANEPEPVVAARRERGIEGLLGERLALPGLAARVYETRLAPNRPAYLADHVVAHATVVPATGFVDMALSAFWSGQRAGATELTGVSFQAFLALPDGGREVQVSVEPGGEGARFRIASAAPADVDDIDAWTLHATGQIRAVDPADEPPTRVGDIHRRMRPEVVKRAALYPQLTEIGLDYGPTFQGLAQVWTGDGEALGRIDLSIPYAAAKAHFAHPAVVDACLHTAAMALSAQGGPPEPHLPVRVDRVRFEGPLGEGSLWCHVTRRASEQPGGPAVVDLVLYDRRGTRKGVLEGLALAPIPLRTLSRLFGTAEADPTRGWVHDVVWEPLARDASTRARADVRADWLLVGPSGTLGEALVDQLSVQSQRARQVAPAELSEALRTRVARGSTSIRVVVMALDAEPDDDLHLRGARECFDAIQALTELRADHPDLALECILLTRGAVATEPGIEAGAPSQAAAWAMHRVVALERADMSWRRLDLDPSSGPAASEAGRVLGQLELDDGELDVAFRGVQRWVARLAPAAGARSTRLPLPDAAGALRVGFAERGSLDQLRLEAAPAVASPPPGWVKLRVEAAGLNFRDVMNVLGTYPGDPGELGLECAGTVVETGEGTDFAPGQRVVGLASGCFQAEVLAPAALLAPLPDCVRAVGAATLPVTFVTAHYALDRLAELKAGERVLIHAGTGGVGMAAIQLARRAGAEIFSTASTPAKRALLRELGVHHVFDSRSLDFRPEIEALTEGEGVDVVLNSLAGPFIEHSVALLREGGRYLEIGKTGIWTPEEIRAFNPRATGFTIALDDLSAEAPQSVGAMLRHIVEAVGEGTLSPLPHTTFRPAGAKRAFRRMIKARHTGKQVLVGLTRAQPVPDDGTVVITGGLGGLGRVVADWVLGQGAPRVLLLGRGAPSEAVQDELDAMAARHGATVGTAQADVCHRAQLARVLADERAQSPIRGVIHAAGVVDDGLLSGQTWARVAATAAPKVLGARHLAELCAEDDLAVFVGFSSMAALPGSAGQAGYALGNAYLDAQVHARRAEGAPGLSVNWGPWAEVGMAARMSETQLRQRAQAGVHGIEPSQGLAILGDLLVGDAVQAAVLPVDWPTYVRTVLRGQVPALLADVVSVPDPPSSPEAAAGDDELQARLRGASTPKARAVVMAEALRDELAGLLGVRPERLALDAELQATGVDSLLGMELIQRFNRRLPADTRLSAAMLFEHGRIDTLAAQLVGHTPREEAVVDWSEEAKPEALSITGVPASAPRHIFLTGATGFFGAHLLRELQGQGIAVTCLARAADDAAAEARIRANFRTLGLPEPEPFTAVAGDLTALRFGLTEVCYEQLARDVDAIVHNAAQVSYVGDYASLRAPNVTGTRHILRFAAHGIPKQLHHISTVGCLVNAGGAATEDTPTVHPSRLPAAYSQTKAVAEQLVELAGAAGLQTWIYRLGEITGPRTEGTWPVGDFVSRFTAGCAELGCYPREVLDTQCRWIPADTGAQAVVALMRRSPGRRFHLLHPVPVPVSDVVGWLQEVHPVEIAPYATWLERLREAVAAGRDNALRPLVDVFADAFDASAFELDHVACAETWEGLTQPGPIDRALVRRYGRGITC